MIIRGLTLNQIQKAVASVPNADWEYIYPLGGGYRVKLKVKDSKGLYHRRGLFHRSSSYIRPDGAMGRKEYPPKRLAALCWHGFKEVFEAMYQLNPATVIITAKIRYQNKEDFEDNYRDTGYQNIGSTMYPVQYNEACDC